MVRIRNWKKAKANKRGKITTTIYIDKKLLLAYDKIEKEGKYNLQKLFEDKLSEVIANHKRLKEMKAI